MTTKLIHQVVELAPDGHTIRVMPFKDKTYTTNDLDEAMELAGRLNSQGNTIRVGGYEVVSEEDSQEQ